MSEQHYPINNIGDLKEYIRRCEAAGATDETTVQVAGRVTLMGYTECIKMGDVVQTGNEETIYGFIYMPNCPFCSLHFSDTVSVPHPDDGPFI